MQLQWLMTWARGLGPGVGLKQYTPQISQPKSRSGNGWTFHINCRFIITDIGRNLELTWKTVGSIGLKNDYIGSGFITSTHGCVVLATIPHEVVPTWGATRPKAFGLVTPHARATS